MVIVHLDGKNTSCIYPTDKISILPEPDDSEVEIMVPLSALTLSIPQATITTPGPTTTTTDVSPPVVGSVTAGGDEIPIISWTPADAARMGISRETMSYLGRMDSARALGNIYDNQMLLTTQTKSEMIGRHPLSKSTALKLQEGLQKYACANRAEHELDQFHTRRRSG